MLEARFPNIIHHRAEHPDSTEPVVNDPRWKILSLGALLASGSVAAPIDPMAATEPSREWPVYGGDFAGTKHSTLSQINRTNVHRLTQSWILRLDDVQGPGSTIECNPLVVNGVMYLTSPGLKVLAVDPATGQQIWTFDPWDGRGGRGVNRGLAYWSDGAGPRIFFTGGTFLYAIHAANGQLIKSFGRDGRVDLREGLDRDVFFLHVTASSPGIIYKDLLILGSAVGEGPGPAAPGHIRAFDVRTGERRWIFHTIPHPGETGYDTWPTNAWRTAGGANSWGGLTLDTRRGWVFCGTGSPSYDHWGGNRIGQNLYANCVLALRADTGDRVWHYQVVHHDIWDYDIPCPPNLVTVRHNGHFRDAVAQSTKMGHIFVLDRDTGRPLFPVEERAVPQSEIPGEQSWPTQPFPLKPPPIAQQRFTEADATGLNPRAREVVLGKLKSMRTGDLFLPPGLVPSVVLPQFNGGGEWGGAAFDPGTRTLYVNASNEAEWISMIPARPRDDITVAELGRMLYGTVCSACHGFERANNPAAPNFATLKGVNQRLTRQQVLELLETGRNQMPSFASFTSIEKRAVTAFLFNDGADELLPAKDLDLSWAEEIPFVATGHHEFRDPEGFPVNQPPWGTLTAINLDDGTFKWQVPLGTYPELEKRGHPPTGTFNIGGPLVTAGGLVFIGAAMDERFHAFDKETGELLWEFQLDAGGYATPATYEIEGRQYVVIAAGGGGKPGTKSGNAYHAFALPE